jgi:hypothetical protein
MNLKPNKMYTVVKKIKLHTKPLVEIQVPQTGLFVKQTDKCLIFRGFKVRKCCVISVKEENEIFN